MLRRLYTGLCAALVSLASLQAPLAHVHPGDPEHHHAQGFAHAHPDLDHHKPGNPEWEPHDPDDATIYLEWAPTTQPRLEIADAAVVPAGVSQPAIVRGERVADFEPQSHSPPQFRLLPARSPPL